MSLERLSDPNEVNIKEVSAEVREKKTDELLFDPERDFTEEDLEIINQRFNESPNYCEDIIFELMVLMPERLKPLLEIPEETIKKERDEVTTNFDTGDLIEHLVMEKQLGRPVELKDDSWEALKDFFDSNSHLETAVKLKVIDSERFKRDEKELIREGLENRLKDRINKEHSILSKLRDLSCLRLLLPDAFDQSMVSRQDWVKAKKDMEECKKAQKLATVDLVFVDYAFHLAVLSAKEVQFDENGLHLIFADTEEFKSEVPPMPKERGY